MTLGGDDRKKIDSIKTAYEQENSMLGEWVSDVDQRFDGDDQSSISFAFHKTWMDYIEDVSSSNNTIIGICDEALAGAISYDEARERINGQHEEKKLSRFRDANQGEELPRYLDSVQNLLGLEYNFSQELARYMEAGKASAK